MISPHRLTIVALSKHEAEARKVVSALIGKTIADARDVLRCADAFLCLIEDDETEKAVNHRIISQEDAEARLTALPSLLQAPARDL